MFDAFKKLMSGGKSGQHADVPESPMQDRAQELLRSALQCLEQSDIQGGLKYLNMSLSYAPCPKAYLEIAKINQQQELIDEVAKNVEKGLSLCLPTTDPILVNELKKLRDMVAPIIQRQEEEHRAWLQTMQERQQDGGGRDAETLQKEFVSLKRHAWIPITEEGDGEADCSKFGGLPIISEHYPWPVCSLCGKLMQHLLQLNFADLPEGLDPKIYGFGKFPAGWLQFFFCTEHWVEDSNSFVTRLVTTSSKPILESIEKPAFAKRIQGWTATDDFPVFEDFSNLLEIGSSDQVDDEWVEELYENRLGCDKLLGWPVWDQSPGYVNCPQCKSQMAYFFQIASEDHVPYLFGDSGTGHIHVCPNDFKMEFTFSS